MTARRPELDRHQVDDENDDAGESDRLADRHATLVLER
jgi:hypothetical protein